MTTAAASFYVTGGTLRQDAPSYVERQADKDLYEGLLRGEFCYVLTSRQMGKSSLMVHTAARLRDAGTQVAVLDLTALGQNLSVEQWYGGLLRRVGLQLDPSGALEEALDDFWFAQEARVGPLERWMTALQQVVLPRVSGRIVLFLDEIDAVRSLPFSTDEFFAAIRECYNRRAQDPVFERLTFCLLGVATPSDLIQDTRTTPFNIGRRIELTDFTPAEAAPLAAGLLPALNHEGHEAHEAHEAAERGGAGAANEEAIRVALLQRILYWTGGHPYLTQRLCQAVAQDPNPKSKIQEPESTVDRHCGELFLSASAREKDDNLLFVRERLLRSEADLAGLLDLYGQVRAGKRVALDDTDQRVSILRLSGITRAAEGCLRVRNRIYARVFDREWVTQHMPDAELRRQRAAYRSGLLRALTLSSCVLAVMTGLALAAISQAHRAEEGQRVLRRNLYAAQMNLAQQSWEEGNVGLARGLLDGWRRAPGQEDLRGFEWRYLWRLCQGDAFFTLHHQGAALGPLALSPDGKLLVSGDEHGAVRLWDLAAKRPIATLSGRPGAIDAAFSPDRRTLAISARDGVIELWDLARRRPAARFKGPRGRACVAFSPDGRLLASGREDHTVRLWDVLKRRAVAVLRGHTDAVRCIVFSPDGRTLASGSHDNTVKLWDVASRRALGTLEGHGDWVRGVKFSPDGKTLATASDDTTVRLWNLATRREIATLAGHKDKVTCLAFSPDGRTLASGSDDNTIKLWDVATKHEQTTLKGHRAWVRAVAFFPDGRTLASASRDGTAKLWDPAPERDAPLVRQKEEINAIAFSPDGRTLAVGGHAVVRGRDAWPVQLWDLASRQRVASLRGHHSLALTVEFSPDGRLLASGSSDKTIKLWDLGTKREIATFSGYPVSLQLPFSPDGKLLAEPCDDNTVKLRDVLGPGPTTLPAGGTRPTLRVGAPPSAPSARRVVATLKGYHRPVGYLAFSPDGKLLVTDDRTERGKLWDVASRREIRYAGPALHGPYVFSPDGRTLLASSGYTEAPMALNLWDLATKRVVTTFTGFRPPYAGVAFSPDGKTLAVSQGNAIELWNLAVGQQVAVLKGHTGVIYRVAFSPDGNLLASAASDGTVRLWSAASFAETDSPGGSAAPTRSGRQARAGGQRQ